MRSYDHDRHIGVVYPAAQLPLIAKRLDRFRPGMGFGLGFETEATIIEINRDYLTAIADYNIMGNAGEVLSELVEEVEKLVR